MTLVSGTQFPPRPAGSPAAGRRFGNPPVRRPVANSGFHRLEVAGIGFLPGLAVGQFPVAVPAAGASGVLLIPVRLAAPAGLRRPILADAVLGPVERLAQGGKFGQQLSHILHLLQTGRYLLQRSVNLPVVDGPVVPVGQPAQQRLHFPFQRGR